MKTTRQDKSEARKKVRTSLCHWCYKRYPKNKMTFVGVFQLGLSPAKTRLICDNCNFKHNVV